MSDSRFTVVAPLSHGEPLAYSMAPRTVPTLVSRFINPRPPEQNWIAISGAPTETIDVKILEDGVPLLAPARDIDYVSALA